MTNDQQHYKLSDFSTETEWALIIKPDTTSLSEMTLSRLTASLRHSRGESNHDEDVKFGCAYSLRANRSKLSKEAIDQMLSMLRPSPRLKFKVTREGDTVRLEFSPAGNVMTYNLLLIGELIRVDIFTSEGYALIKAIDKHGSIQPSDKTIEEVKQHLQDSTLPDKAIADNL